MYLNWIKKTPTSGGTVVTYGLHPPLPLMFFMPGWEQGVPLSGDFAPRLFPLNLGL